MVSAALAARLVEQRLAWMRDVLTGHDCLMTVVLAFAFRKRLDSELGKSHLVEGSTGQTRLIVIRRAKRWTRLTIN